MASLAGPAVGLRMAENERRTGPAMLSDFRARIIDDRPAGSSVLDELDADPGISWVDARSALSEEWRTAVSEAEKLPAMSFRWAYYPWRRTAVSVPDPDSFRRLRLDRNRNKITAAEQDALGRLRIGIAGLSVGHAVAHVLAMEGLAGELRLADFDDIELSNLNRIPATLLDLGSNKALVAARRVAEIDPYLSVEVFADGVWESNLEEFLTGLDLVIDECDSLDMKLRIREQARRLRIPVMMETNDRGTFDVERFDLEPDRPIFHGLLAGVRAEDLAGLSARDKVPHAMKIVQVNELSGRMAASMVEVGRTVAGWPQLGGEVQLGAATVAAAVRRFGSRGPLPSGRVRVDLDSLLDDLTEPPTERAGELSDDDVELSMPAHDARRPIDAVVEAVQWAPSGGNSQPWQVSVPEPSVVEIRVARSRTSRMDVRLRGSYVAIGAATFNARVAAARWDKNAVVRSDGGHGDLLARVELTDRPADPALARLYGPMRHRMTNRGFGDGRPLTDEVRAALVQAATAENAALRILEGAAPLDEVAEILAAADRVRFLTPELHEDMMSEVKWPGEDSLDLGLDVRTLMDDEVDQLKLRVAARPDVMSYLAHWDVGDALGDPTRDRVKSSAAVAVVTVAGQQDVDYLRGGVALERVWIVAQTLGLAVQPVSPVFLYGTTPAELQGLSARYADDLADLSSRFRQLVQVSADESMILVLRLSRGVGQAVRSRRLPREVVFDHRRKSE